MIKLFEEFAEVDEVKETIFNYAVETYDPEIIEFFLNKGYDIDTDNALDKASRDDKTLRYMLEKGADIEYLSKYRLENDDVQKVLIDLGYERYIHDTVGFNRKLENDPKYADIIQQVKDMEKYNL